MKIQSKKSVLFALSLLAHTFLFSQTLELGTLSSFHSYTGTGAVTNSGTLTGDVGTNDGIISGFVPSNFTGTIYNNEASTVQARIDLLRVYIHLSDIFVDYPSTHAPAFGSGETIAPGVYSIGGAGSIAGTLTLDGGGDPDAVFIVKFEGAITIAASSTIVLSGGTRACNVFWIAEGAISDAGASVIKGTLFSHPGAVTLGVNSKIEGRLFSSEGAITIGAGSLATIPAGPITIPINCPGECSPASAVDVLRSVSGFALFTSFGAVANAATSGIIGDIGTNGGAISGFSTSTQVGSFYNSDAITAQASVDLEYAYNQLILLPNTQVGHTPAFGSGEILNAGVYHIGAAGSLAGTIILDGQNDPDAIFVFKFDGAFSVAAQSKVIFTHGTRRCNVFWIAEGAASIGTFTFMKGTVIAHGGACTIGANGNVEGRMLSTSGAIGFSTGVIYNDELCFPSSSPLPIELLSFTAIVSGASVNLNWATASEKNNDYFNIERSIDGVVFNSQSKINGAGNSTHLLSYSAVDDKPLLGISYYRLKQTDYNGEATYSKVEAVEVNNRNDFVLNIFPNPLSIETTFQTDKNLTDASLIVYNSYGQVVKQIENISGRSFTLARENLSNGIYFVKLLQNNEVLASDKLIITNK
ncbi:MAG: hypothetical protein ACJA1C_000525 [Crocinitomicaceae bacterium]|jgi:hypothetical protein